MSALAGVPGAEVVLDHAGTERDAAGEQRHRRLAERVAAARRGAHRGVGARRDGRAADPVRVHRGRGAAPDRQRCPRRARAASMRITLQFHPDWPFRGRRVIEALADDGVYRSQFETGTSNGGLTAHPGGDRWRWESRIFDGRYDDAEPRRAAAVRRARPARGPLRRLDPVRVGVPRAAAGGRWSGPRSATRTRSSSRPRSAVRSGSAELCALADAGDAVTTSTTTSRRTCTARCDRTAMPRRWCWTRASGRPRARGRTPAGLRRRVAPRAAGRAPTGSTLTTADRSSSRSPAVARCRAGPVGHRRRGPHRRPRPAVAEAGLAPAGALRPCALPNPPGRRRRSRRGRR